MPLKRRSSSTLINTAQTSPKKTKSKPLKVGFAQKARPEEDTTISDETGKMDNAHTADNFHVNPGNIYKAFVTTLQLDDEDLIVLSANSGNRRYPIRKPTEIPNNITGMIPYFHTNSRPAKDKRFSVWTTARISHNLQWEVIVENARYCFTDEGIVMMNKRIQTFKTQIPGYLQFVDNNADPLDLTYEIQADIDNSLTWTIYIREPFELD